MDTRYDFGAETARVFDVPGHTRGHIAFWFEGSDALFCGDTLFAAGCGRVFDGTLADLYRSLARIAALPADILFYCAHEYTLDNLGFARWVEPDNPAIEARLALTHQALDEGRPTACGPLSEELATNPFLRVSVPSVMRAAQAKAGHRLDGPAEVFAVLRTWKDTEYD